MIRPAIVGAMREYCHRCRSSHELGPCPSDQRCWKPQCRRTATLDIWAPLGRSVRSCTAHKGA